MISNNVSKAMVSKFKTYKTQERHQDGKEKSLNTRKRQKQSRMKQQYREHVMSENF